MLISTAQNNVNFHPVEVSNFDELCKILCDKTIKAYSLGTYKDDYRNLKNFIQCKCIGLDIDNDKHGQIMSLNEAKTAFKDYKHIIATTRSHQKEKHGIVVDRFRVILFLKEPILDIETFYRVWHGLKREFNVIDPQCKDASRYWFPSNKIEQIQKEGNYVKIPEKVIEENTTSKDSSPNADRPDTGKLSYNTMKFLLTGADAGSRNGSLFKAALDCREQGYGKEYVIEMVTNMIKITGNWGTSYLNEKDLEAINNAYNRETKYDKRPDIKVFHFKHIKETMQDEEIKTDWLVDKLLSVGGLSLWIGQPKSGKSTLLRQLCICIAQGKPFLDRKIKQGMVYCLSLEEQESIVKDQLNAQKVNFNDSIYVHYGPCGNDIELLENILVDNQVNFLVIDTMALFLDTDDLNNYGIVNKLLKDCRNIARNSGCHIALIHHQNKNELGGTKSIMGSNAIHGGVDNALVLETSGDHRVFTSSQRGGVRFKDKKLNFNSKTELYSIAKKETNNNQEDW